MKKILLIGGAGYIGSVVTSHFLKIGYKVSVLDNFIYNNQFSILPYMGDPDYSFRKGSMQSNEDLESISEGVTDVIILAGLVGDPITKKYPTESQSINDSGVKNCIDFFNGRGINKVIFISTCSNYGLIGDHELADEDFNLNPLSLYAQHKVGNEKYLLGKKETVDYTGVVLRFGTAFGLSPRMRFDLSVSDFTINLYINEELMLFDEHTWRPYCHVRDFARLLETVISTENTKVYFEVFNVGGDNNNYTKKMMVEEILSFLPDRKVKYAKNGNDPRNYRVSFQKVKTILGFEPVYSVRDGVRELIEALAIGCYSDYSSDSSKYGNYSIRETKMD